MSYATAATRSNSQQSSQHDRPESRRDPSQEQQKDKQKPVSQTDQDFHLVQSRAHHTKQESVLEQQPHELDHEGNEIKPLGCLKPDAAEFIPVRIFLPAHVILFVNLSRIILSNGAA